MRRVSQFDDVRGPLERETAGRKTLTAMLKREVGTAETGSACM